MKCPTCKNNPAVVLMDTVQECEDCYKLSHTPLQVEPAMPDRWPTTPLDPTGLRGEDLIAWCRNNPGYLIKVSDRLDDEYYTGRAIVTSKMISNNECRQAYRYRVNPHDHWATANGRWHIHSNSQCYGIWSFFDPAPWNPQE